MQRIQGLRFHCHLAVCIQHSRETGFVGRESAAMHAAVTNSGFGCRTTKCVRRRMFLSTTQTGSTTLIYTGHAPSMQALSFSRYISQL